MIDYQRTVFFLHGLGVSAASSAPLAAALGKRFRVVGIDLPGHGGAPDGANGLVDAIANAALATIETRADGGPWPARYSAAPVRLSCWPTPPLKCVRRRRRSVRSTEADRKRTGDSLQCPALFFASGRGSSQRDPRSWHPDLSIP